MHLGQKALAEALKPRKSKRKTAALRDLEWAYNRLDHLVAIAQEECWNSRDFSGPAETMQAVRDYLPKLRLRYGFEKTWPHGRGHKPDADTTQTNKP